VELLSKIALWEIAAEFDAMTDGGGLRIRRCPGLAAASIRMFGYGQVLYVAAGVAELPDGFIGSPRERMIVRVVAGVGTRRECLPGHEICSNYWVKEMNAGVAHPLHRFVPH
jgi:hypothetical protein